MALILADCKWGSQVKANVNPLTRGNKILCPPEKEIIRVNGPVAGIKYELVSIVPGAGTRIPYSPDFLKVHARSQDRPIRYGYIAFEYAAIAQCTGRDR